MEYTGAGQSVYVQGINNLYEMDRGPNSGWRYYVNGVIGNRSAGVIKLSKGDQVEWRYTNDYKKRMVSDRDEVSFFSSVHPIVSLLYFIGVAVMSMMLLHPVFF
ncbi:hypothetical protein GCM10020331_058300 [Ectobacillus funiculus]